MDLFRVCSFGILSCAIIGEHGRQVIIYMVVRKDTSFCKERWKIYDVVL